MSRSVLLRLNFIWSGFCLVQLGTGLYLASTAEEHQHNWAPWWVLCASVLQGMGLLVKDCIPRQEGRHATWVWLMCTFIIVIFPLSLTSSGVGTYLLQEGVRQQSTGYVATLALASVLNYAYSFLLVALIVRFIKSHHHRRSTVTPSLILEQRLIESPLSEEEIARIPEYRATDAGDDCPVCLDSIVPDTKIKVCPTCSKRSHSSCINCSLAHKPLCPTCRANWRQAHNL